MIPGLRQASSASSGRQTAPPANLLGPQLRLRTLFGAEIVQNLVHLLDTQFARVGYVLGTKALLEMDLMHAAARRPEAINQWRSITEAKSEASSEAKSEATSEATPQRNTSEDTSEAIRRPSDCHQTRDPGPAELRIPWRSQYTCSAPQIPTGR